MIEAFAGTRSVGFDLDDTLYPPDPRIDDLIRNEVSAIILARRPELGDVRRVRIEYDAVYREVGSWTRILAELDVEHPRDVMREIVSNPGILDLIERDDRLVEILEKISTRYDCFLITNSPRAVTLGKLAKIGIDPGTFGDVSCGDDPGSTPKIQGRVFAEFLQRSPHRPSEHVYVGDALRSDVLPANACGMQTVAVGTPIPEADRSIARIHEIEQLLL